MKIARFAIFFTGMIGLTLGGILCISSLQTEQEAAVLRTNENLKSQAQVFVDQFYGILEAIKNSSDPASLPYVTYRGVLKFNQGVPAEIESLDQVKSLNSNTSGVGIDFAFEELVLSALKNQVTLGDLALSKMAVGIFDLSEVGSREGIFVVLKESQKLNVAPASNLPATAMGSVAPQNPSEIITTSAQAVSEKLSFFLLDPSQALSAMARVNADQKNVFLIHKNGRVLVHSNRAFLGTDLRKVTSLKDMIENLFLGAQTGAVGKYHSVDGTEEHIAFVRAGLFPFAVAVEQKAAVPVLSLPWWLEQYRSGAARKNLGVLFLTLAAAFSLFSGMSIWLNREMKRVMSQGVSFRKLNEEKPLPVLSQNEHAHLAPVENFQLLAEAQALKAEAFQQLETAKNAIKNSVPEKMKKSFSETISNAFTIETIEKELVEACTELTESPTLFFRYQKNTQNLNLTAVGGSVVIPNYSVMNAYVRKDIEMQIENLASEGKVASINHYGPLNKLMMANLNVAHYEAWAVTSEREMSLGSKWVGVLVVLQAGFKSTEVRPILAKLLKEAGSAIQARNARLVPQQKDWRVTLGDSRPFEFPSNS